MLSEAKSLAGPTYEASVLLSSMSTLSMTGFLDGCGQLTGCFWDNPYFFDNNQFFYGLFCSM